MQQPVIKQPVNMETVQQAAVSAAQTTQQQQQQQFQRLKVEDALTYLDQVKLQFGNQPQVYNDFLDIMKEFKSQSIDTPGVINRVSTLFRGHPDLIVGFNTFLPPGYKIEADSHTISVHQPGQQVVSMPHNQAGGLPTSTPQTCGYRSAIVNTIVTAQSGIQTATSTTSAVSSVVGNQQQQPVEFNHAINYVNKIKNRFSNQPDVYKSFLEILHTYQKEQKSVKDPQLPNNVKPLTESEVYSQVANLFQNQEDLLSEFGQFLPDANGAAGQYGTLSCLQGVSIEALGGMRNEHLNQTSNRKQLQSTYPLKTSKPTSSIRRPLAQLTQPAPKKAKYSAGSNNSITTSQNPTGISFSEAGKHATLSEYAFFERIKKAIKLQETYDSFLKCLILFNNEIVNRSELVQLVSPIFEKHQDLFKWFKNFLGCKDDSRQNILGSINSSVTDGLPRINSDLAMEIDFNTCKKHGASYRALPASLHLPKCSGRTPLCHEVLNNTYVSFPTWSEDSTFVTSRKSQFEENIYRCEDERFELDMIIDLNNDALKHFEYIQRKINRMTQEECSKFHLEDTLGGSSDVLYRKVIERVYGDKAGDIVDGLKKHPVMAFPIVIKRLKQKQEEWREMQKCFQKTWRETNEKYYLKSLDHQCNIFKASDLKSIRSKMLFHQIESLFDTRQELIGKRDKCEELTKEEEEKIKEGPHLILNYSSMETVKDANNLLIYHTRRQTGMSNKEKKKIKYLLMKTFSNIMYEKEGSLSDDEDDKDGTTNEDEKDKEPEEIHEDVPDMPIRPTEQHYTMMVVNNNWYLLFRLHNLLAERMYEMKKIANEMEEYERIHSNDRKESAAVALRLRAPKSTEPDRFYESLIECIHQLLDGNIESSTYEDDLREMFHTKAYLAFTLDKMVQNGVRQLLHVVNDERCLTVTKIWKEQCHLGIGMGKCESRTDKVEGEVAYAKKIEQALTDENLYKIVYQTAYDDQPPKLLIELLDTETDGDSQTNSTTEQERDRWAVYVEKYVSDASMQSALTARFHQCPVFLQRNIRSYRKAAEQDQEIDEMEMVDNTECKFNMNSQRLRYVSRSGSIYYKRKILSKSRERHPVVSLAKWKKFQMVLEEFSKKNINEDQLQNAQDWFENGMSVKKLYDESEEPYHFYRRYLNFSKD